ncbi:MAG: hypothetical protein ACI9XB_004839 [Gammaproteobacteria bacterium]|jgi:hypothetical protein
MRFFFFFLLFAAVLPASAQVFVNKVDVNSRPVQYVEIWEKFNKENGKILTMLDYGQQDDLKDRAGKLLFVTNQKGQYLEFNSMVDALNFMFRNGWEVMHAKTSAKVQSYILKKRNGFTMNSSVKKLNNSTADSVYIKTATELTGKIKQSAKSKTIAPKSSVKEKAMVVAEKEAHIPSVEVTRVSKKEVPTTKEKKQ